VEFLPQASQPLLAPYGLPTTMHMNSYNVLRIFIFALGAQNCHLWPKFTTQQNGIPLKQELVTANFATLEPQ